MSKGIITLCGSTRFYKLFDEMNYKLTLKNYIVISIGCHTNHDSCLGVAEIEGAKVMLDKLHKEKISLSDAILVIDKGGYIGDSTRSELMYAIDNKKKIFYYSKPEDLEQLLYSNPLTIRDLTNKETLG